MSHAQNHYLVASDFDQTLSYNDSGFVLSEMLGIAGFEHKVRVLAEQNFVQQGAELSYLLRFDPSYRQVRRDHLIAAGKNIRLKRNVHRLEGFFDQLSRQHRFTFHVISAAPQVLVESALDGIIPADRIHGTRFEFGEDGAIVSIVHCPAGHGKVTVVNQLQTQLQIGRGRVIYMGDGSSDIQVMLHVNRCGGLTIAVSENKHIAHAAKRTVLSDDVLGTTIPVLEDILGWSSEQVLRTIESNGCIVHEWDKLRSDTLTISTTPVEVV